MDMFSLCYFLSFPVQIRFLVVPDPRILRCRPLVRFHRMWCPAPLT
ncbi:TPA: hypothetical protein HH461_004829 [Escherichia coli]|uniref:Uncharacterized protein n=2 Tax=Enterobacteriaceae TaxID=543 RepID=A0A145YY17_ECOLX|nr:hypothetical protein [Escherichia coli]EDN7248053.1 hypothetical protein [Salmonella enterica subsp. enterica serovar Typhimurium]EDR2271070.1 hypothetical protein [Salmonella enterica]EDV9428433.1 hypothetical protein [Salmonella enterica subsp. enterica serovar Typhimurium]EDW1620590.1 hypothetical protein [Salmonella enterica subsp. enterica serovar Typhimurium]